MKSFNLDPRFQRVYDYHDEEHGHMQDGMELEQ